MSFQLILLVPPWVSPALSLLRLPCAPAVAGPEDSSAALKQEVRATPENQGGAGRMAAYHTDLADKTKANWGKAGCATETEPT